MKQRFTGWMDFHAAMAQNIQDPNAQRPTGRSEEIERLQTAIRQHDATIRTLEANLREVRRLRDDKVGRLAYLTVKPR